ncbi:MAG: hypothetical protein K940chlam9_00440 [Chlamydiae bacterium]|nr:hypothetical protein [Chlamydiota bacterium]
MFKRYLDPKNDLAFKKIFGSEKHKEIPIDFLNASLCLEGEDQIEDLEFLNTVQPPEVEARKESIVDVLVRDQKGNRYIVEMQVAKIQGFEKRAQYYAAKTYCAHFNSGHKYSDLKRVIFLAITDYIVFPEKKDYKSDHVILDNKTLEHDLKDLSFTFVELPKFHKENHELVTIEDKWYYFFKHAHESDNVNELIANHPEIKEAYEALDRFNWTEKEILGYEKLIMNTADNRGILDAAIEEGMEKGMEKGIQKGMQKGIEKGMEEGIRKTAQGMLKHGIPLEEIVNITGLSEAEIQTLSTISKR